MHGESNLHVVFDGWRILKAIAAEALDRSETPDRGGGPPTRRLPAPPRTCGGSAARVRDRLFEAPERAGSAAPSLISVVICAHTELRFDETCAAVQSVRDQSFPNKEIIVVVDHNPALHASLSEALPDVTVVENREETGAVGREEHGHRAWPRGDVVAFLDDDAIADHDWLKFFADRFTDPAVVGVGGLTLPEWKAPRPSWFPREFDWVVGCTYRGMPESNTPVRNLLGGNSSFRREASSWWGVPERHRPVSRQAPAGL